jgi:hypothetical protein
LSSPIEGEDAKEPKESPVWLNGVIFRLALT